MVRPPPRRKDDPRVHSLIELRKRTRDKEGQALLTKAIWAARKAQWRRVYREEAENLLGRPGLGGYGKKALDSLPGQPRRRQVVSMKGEDGHPLPV
eukprot:11362175-Alexandrium_andersonii.AAC.1